MDVHFQSLELASPEASIWFANWGVVGAGMKTGGRGAKMYNP